jgi:nucleotide-binding universal stress UspA family protein
VSATPRGVIGVGFDGSPQSHDALAAGAELARALGAKLRLIAVGEPADRLLPAPDGAQPWPSVDDQRAASSHAMIDRAVGVLAATGLDVSGDVVHGFAHDGLQRFSDEVDVLVLGSCRYGPLRRILLGSTAEQLLDCAHCPVVVVPRVRAHTAQAAIAPAVA